MAKNQKPTIEELITKTVIATRLSCAREPRDIFKATEKRLYAYPVLQAKIKNDQQMIDEIMQYGVHERSKSITRFIKSGIRLDPDEIEEAIILDLKARIANDQHEITQIEKALEQIVDDEYKDIVQYKYFEQKTDDEIAEYMHCAARTVRAHKSRLVGRLSVFLYGAGVLE